MAVGIGSLEADLPLGAVVGGLPAQETATLAVVRGLPDLLLFVPAGPWTCGGPAVVAVVLLAGRAGRHAVGQTALGGFPEAGGHFDDAVGFVADGDPGILHALEVHLDHVPPGGLLLGGDLEVFDRVLPDDGPELPDHLLQEVVVLVQHVAPHHRDHEGAELLLDPGLGEALVHGPVADLDPVGARAGIDAELGAVEAENHVAGVVGVPTELEVEDRVVHHLGGGGLPVDDLTHGGGQHRHEAALRRDLDRRLCPGQGQGGGHDGARGRHGLRLVAAGLGGVRLGGHVLGPRPQLIDEPGQLGVGGLDALGEVQQLVAQGGQEVPHVGVAGARLGLPLLLELGAIFRRSQEVHEGQEASGDVPFAVAHHVVRKSGAEVGVAVDLQLVQDGVLRGDVVGLDLVRHGGGTLLPRLVQHRQLVLEPVVHLVTHLILAGELPVEELDDVAGEPLLQGEILGGVGGPVGVELVQGLAHHEGGQDGLLDGVLALGLVGEAVAGEQVVQDAVPVDRLVHRQVLARQGGLDEVVPGLVLPGHPHEAGDPPGPAGHEVVAGVLHLHSDVLAGGRDAGDGEPIPELLDAMGGEALNAERLDV